MTRRKPSDPYIGAFLGLACGEDAADVGNTIRAALNNAARQKTGRPDWAEASQSTPQAQGGKAAGNGSLMRTLPIALAHPDPEKMLDVSARISAMTHWDPQAEVCCALYCLWVREVLYGVEPRRAWETALVDARAVVAEGRRSPETPGPTPLPDRFWPRLEAAPARQLEDLQPTEYAGYVLDCLEAAVWAATNTASLEEALVTLVNLGGETDTMAAVAGGAVGADHGQQEIPERWREALFQRDRIEQVARDLFDIAGEEDGSALPANDLRAVIDIGVLAGVEAHVAERSRAIGKVDQDGGRPVGDLESIVAEETELETPGRDFADGNAESKQQQRAGHFTCIR